MKKRHKKMARSAMRALPKRMWKKMRADPMWGKGPVRFSWGEDHTVMPLLRWVHTFRSVK